MENAVTTTTDYLTGYQYKNGSLQFFPTAEGFVNFSEAQKGSSNPGGTYSYAYNFLDHLGNVRLTYAQDPVTLALRIMEENHFFPFGLKHTGYNSDQLMYTKQGTTTKIVPVPPLFKTSYNFKFNSKMLEEDLGLNVYDYGARYYDAAAPRFWQIDPLSETSRRFSPYSYALDNPVFFIDRDGMYADTLESQNIEDCCPGFPFGRNSPKETSPLGDTMQNFTPSNKTMSLLSEGKELLSNVFGYEASATAGYGLGLEGKVGPVKVEGELTLAEAEVKTTNKNLIEAGIKAPGFKLNASLGEKKAELKGSLSTAKVEVDKNLNVKTSSEGATLKGTISKGDTNLSLKNSGTLGLSIKLPSPEGVSGKIGATVNLYNAVKGVGKMIEGGASYLSDYVSNFFSGN